MLNVELSDPVIFSGISVPVNVRSVIGPSDIFRDIGTVNVRNIHECCHT